MPAETATVATATQCPNAAVTRYGSEGKAEGQKRKAGLFFQPSPFRSAGAL
jgi:hypothetical protein